MTVILVELGTTMERLEPNRYCVDFSSPDQLGLLHATLNDAQLPPVGSLINLVNLQEPFGETAPDDDAPLTLSIGVLNFVKEFSDDFQRSAANGGGWLMNVTALDGRFGCSSRRSLPIAQAGTFGIFKTLAREIPRASVKNVDVSPDLPTDDLSDCLLREFFAADDRLEVGVDAEGRWTISGEPDIVEQTKPELPVDSDSVVVITGGACGVTAAVATELARQSSATLILVGRSPLPDEEAEETSRHQQTQELRQHLILAARQSGKAVKPAEIEARLRRILKDREIQENLARMKEAGSNVEYHAVDVRDRDRFGRLIEDVYQRHGRIDGVIHGAGIVEDKWIRDKTAESFSRVFSTKVDSAMTLARHLRPESLKFLLFFSSVTARFGTAGQVDYAAANEVLNKLAAHLNANWPGRVTAINWGPWRGGMVTDELLRLYQTRNIPVIEIAAGAAKCVNELRIHDCCASEVLIAAGDRNTLMAALGT